MGAKLEEKHQKILRTLLQEPDNKRCADCTAKGPVYANTTLNTFLCTTCSGIHREFNHRVKSVSMANFKPEEIEGLQKGGNKVAREYYMARWSQNDFPEPDSNDKDRIRQFIRLKYVEKRWVARGNNQRPPQQQQQQHQQHNVRSEPLTNVLGNDIPPIRVEMNTPRNMSHPVSHSNNSQSSSNSNSFTSLPSSNSNSFTSLPNHHSNHHQQQQQVDPNAFFGGGFEANWNQASSQQPQQSQVIDPFKRQNPVEDKASTLKNQINAMFSQTAQAQQQAFAGMNWQQQMMMGQPQMVPGQQMVHGQPQMVPGQPMMPGNPMMMQQMQQPGVNPMMVHMMPQQPANPMMMGVMGQQQFPGQFPMQQQQQMNPMMPNQFGQPTMAQQFPGQPAANPSPFTATPVVPEKPDPFASLSLSSLSKPQQQQQPKPVSVTPMTNNGNVGKPANIDDLFGMSTPAPVTNNTHSVTNNNDLFFGNGHTSNPAPSMGATQNNHHNEFNPFGISQTSHVTQQQQQQSNDFNPFF